MCVLPSHLLDDSSLRYTFSVEVECTRPVTPEEGRVKTGQVFLFAVKCFEGVLLSAVMSKTKQEEQTCLHTHTLRDIYAVQYDNTNQYDVMKRKKKEKKEKVGLPSALIGGCTISVTVWAGQRPVACSP